jgi:hypothetical protein
MIKDAHGKRSITLLFVSAAFVAVLFKFLVSGIVITTVVPGVEGEVLVTTAAISAGEFGAAVLAILTPWLGREWRAAHYDTTKHSN